MAAARAWLWWLLLLLQDYRDWQVPLGRRFRSLKVWFVLLRNGSLQEAGIDDSSNSIILDNAALATVRRTTYAPWPEGTWPSQAQHKFTVTLDFVPLN